jgi:hypothetical protein
MHLRRDSKGSAEDTATASGRLSDRVGDGTAPIGKDDSGQGNLPRKPYVSLEDPDTLELIEADPRGFLHRYRSGLVIDEAQRSPRLFSYLLTAADEPHCIPLCTTES